LLQLLLSELRLRHRAGSHRLRCTESLLLLLLLLEKLRLLRLLRLLDKLLLLLRKEMGRQRINLTVLVVISGESFQGNLLSGQLRHWDLSGLLGSKLLLGLGSKLSWLALLELLGVLLELLRVLLELLRVLLELLRVLSKLLVLLELSLELAWLLLLGELGLSLGLGSLLELEGGVWLLGLRGKLSWLVLLELLGVLLELLRSLLELLGSLLELLGSLLELLGSLLELLGVLSKLLVLLELLRILLELLLALEVSEVLVEVASVELLRGGLVGVEVSGVEDWTSGSLSAVSKVLSLGRGVILTSDLLLLLHHRLLEGDDGLVPLFLKLESRVGLLWGELSLSERIDLDELQV